MPRFSRPEAIVIAAILPPREGSLFRSEDYARNDKSRDVAKTLLQSWMHLINNKTAYLYAALQTESPMAD